MLPEERGRLKFPSRCPRLPAGVIGDLVRRYGQQVPLLSRDAVDVLIEGENEGGKERRFTANMGDLPSYSHIPIFF